MTPKQKDLLVCKEVIHKGVKIILKVDYVRRTVSLVEYNGHKYDGKKWLFAERTVDYMASWRNILKAMEKAVNIGEAMLQQRLDEESEELAKQLHAMGDMPSYPQPSQESLYNPNK